jgi:hypothetical protein
LPKIEVSRADASLTQDFVNCWAVVNHNSSPGVAAVIEGIPVILTDADRSQARDVATVGIHLIENPLMLDRQAWIERISQFHWSHAELQSGACWAHMKKWAKK